MTAPNDDQFLDDNDDGEGVDLAELEGLEGLEPPEDLMTEVDTLRATLDDRTAELRAREADLERRDAEQSTVLDRYRAALAASDPDVTVDDITGETLEEIDTSFAAFRDLALRVRAARTPVPPVAAPAGPLSRRRRGPVTAFDKIKAGLETME
jgi:hypothetical protein